MARVKPEAQEVPPVKKAGGHYFGRPNTSIQFIPSGCTLFDLALGGGWARRRIANVVGNRSSGKSLLCIEAAANFNIIEPKGKIRYRESESAFDPSYAQALGFPVDAVDFGEPMETVEDLFEDLTAVVEKARGPELYIVDSLDALSDRSEMERDIEQGSYGAEKAKKMSQLFRRLTSQLAHKDVTTIFVSQVRDNVGGAMFAKKYVRSGGRALDFYASVIVMLTEIGKVPKTIAGVKRSIGIDVLAKLEKNKVALPYREAEFPIIFGYGIDDRDASLTWLKSVTQKGDTVVKDTISDADLKRMVEDRWWEIENKFLPDSVKYPVKG